VAVSIAGQVVPTVLGSTSEGTAYRPGGLHRDKYEYRIGWGSAKADWLIRYEFLEDPRAEYEGQYLYANAHIHFNAGAANDRFLKAIPARHFPTRKIWLEEVLAGVCADVILPRCRERGKDERPVMEALAQIEARLARLGGTPEVAGGSGPDPEIPQTVPGLVEDGHSTTSELGFTRVGAALSSARGVM
jgi:hypothetical protein